MKNLRTLLLEAKQPENSMASALQSKTLANTYIAKRLQSLEMQAFYNAFDLPCGYGALTLQRVLFRNTS